MDGDDELGLYNTYLKFNWFLRFSNEPLDGNLGELLDLAKKGNNLSALGGQVFIHTLEPASLPLRQGKCYKFWKPKAHRTLQRGL